MRLPSIPTMYRSTRFRSRLEARWACFFDLIGWKWEYEPFDSDGYIPDFAILGAAPLLVEVKPGLSCTELAPHTGKAGRAGRDIMIVGATPNLGPPLARVEVEALGFSISQPTAGIMLQETPDPGWNPMTGGAEWHRCSAPDCSQIAVHHTFGSYHSYPCGHYEGDHFLDRLETETLRVLWATATNTTQWHK